MERAKKRITLAISVALGKVARSCLPDTNALPLYSPPRQLDIVSPARLPLRGDFQTARRDVWRNTNSGSQIYRFLISQAAL